MELCAISNMPYDECDSAHEGECVWLCGDCGGNVYTCVCEDNIPEFFGSPDLGEDD